MSEQCPLVGIKFDEEIPQFCLDHCSGLWENAKQTQTPGYDSFTDYTDTDDCPHVASQFSSEALQSGEGAERFYTINHECSNCRGELDSETYSFACPS